MDIIIGLDKIKMKYYYTGSPHGKDEYGQLHGWIGCSLNGDFGVKGSLTKVHAESSLSRLHQKLPEGGYVDAMYGQTGKKQKAKQGIWLQFNPSKLSGADLAALKGHMSILLEDGFMTMLRSGWMSYMEINIDIRGVPFDEYMYLDSSLRTASAAFESVGTMYIGSKKSNRRFTVYDKSKEQKYGGDYATETLRVEAILQGAKGFPLAEIDAQPSPFGTLFVVDRVMLAKSTNPLANEFRSRLTALGCSPQAAYLSFPLKQRKELKKALNELQPDWWKPEQIWKKFPESLDWMMELL
ncbi:hypothetical protein [Rhodanobacter sp. UC4436_H3]